MMRRWALLGLGLLGLAGARVEAEAKDVWLHAQTEHFDVYAATGEREAAEIVGDLELFRSAVVDELGESMGNRARVRIVLWDREWDFEAFKPIPPEEDADPLDEDGLWKRYERELRWRTVGAGNPNRTMSTLRTLVGPPRLQRKIGWVGHGVDGGNQDLDVRYGADEDVSWIALSGERRWEHTARAMRWPYVKLHLDQQRKPLPLWYEDGVAAILREFRVVGDDYALGSWSSSRGSFLVAMRQLTAWPDFFQQSAGDEVFELPGARYAYASQAWLLLQHARFNRKDDTRLAEALQAALDDPRLKGGDVGDRVFAQAEIAPEELTEALEKLLRRQRSREVYRRLGAKVELDFRVMAETEVETLLEDMKVRLRRDPETVAALRERLEANAQDRRALSLLGLYALDEAELGAAETYWERAVLAGSEVSAHLRLAPQLAVEGRWHVLEFGDWTEADAARLPEWRMRLRSILATDPTDESAIEVLAWVEALAADVDAENVALVEGRLAGMGWSDLTEVALLHLQLRREADNAEARAKLEAYAHYADELLATVAGELWQMHQNKTPAEVAGVE
ncbi:hypothetical protein [Actomonas aquatica]|uniref:DUF4034 domain-containing protein n=1 Tax=Actomonas aquatica TaxID=2866162 RepID=A0ABZ1CCG9_9BACT|nr:hypothetical protein [Opitutus sp. WL0086]WRQ89351.1 hypothetical protein K1X11_008015 [Opitutus sp. WL0086]